MAAIFGRAHHDYRVRRTCFIARALAFDAQRNGDEKNKDERRQRKAQNGRHALQVRYSDVNIVRYTHKPHGPN
jgi:LPS O-antigen subunit length determinant protein (WzzB/FepE family)